ncbi:MAG: VWA domain-containing protein [Lentisphaerae bacterium]|nr:VWA domain-containing protein [Lentisphaerota bacterium]
MNGTWYHLSILHALWLLPVFCALFAYAAWKRHQALKAFTGTALLEKLTATYSSNKRLLKHILFLLAILFLILAMARPAWNPVPQTVRREGRDVIFLLDVSRSMLADDLKPNRLERAKLAIDDCLEVLEGDRVALAVFAGNTVVRCPLTQDYGFFRMMLADVSTDTVSRGGTLIGDALRKVARDVFDQQERQYKDIVLITDGEDHESFPLEAAKTIGEAGIRLIAVGLGDETGTPIVITDESGRRDVLKYKGEIVRSRLDSDTLRAMVNATPGGRYLPVATGNIELDKVYQNLIATAAKRELESQTLERFEEKFQVFLVLCLICLALESLISDRKSLRKLAVLLLGICSLTEAAQASKLLKSGNQALSAGKYEEALDKYQQAALEEPESPYLHYNQGLAYFHLEDYAKAIEFFQQAADKAKEITPPDTELAARAKLAIGNSFFKECKRQQDSDLKKAVEACEKSIVNYQDALRLNPKLTVAKANMKQAQLALKKLMNDLKELLKEQQQQQQQAKEQEEKLEKLAQQQQQAAEQSAKADKDGDQTAQTQQKLLEEQQQISKETRKLAEERPEQQDPVRQKMDEASEQQKQAEEALEEQQFKEASEKQKEAAKLLKEAREQMQQEQQAQQEQQQQQQGEPEQKPEEDASEKQEQQAQETPEDSAEQEEKEQEAFNLSEDASDILDEERKNQRQRRLQRPAETRPVDKDW